MFSIPGTLISFPSPEHFEYLSTELTPSESEPCHCFSCFKRSRKDRKKFTVRRMPGKVTHLVPMQRFDSIIVRRAVSITKPSTTDYQLPTKLPPNATTSIDDSSINPWPPPPPTTAAAAASLPAPFQTPSYEQATNVNNSNDHDNLLSQTRLQMMLSRFQQDLEVTPYRLDQKRSSV